MTTDTAFIQNSTIYAHWTYTGGSGGGDNGGSGADIIIVGGN